MRKFLLYSSALVAGGLLNGLAEASCIQTPTCSSLGYTSSSSCTGGVKCPFGEAWNCTSINKIIELEKTIEELQTKIIVMNCKVGDILYSDMTCGENNYSDKTAIGVVFDATKGLAIAKDEFTNFIWGAVVEDVSGVQNSNSVSTSAADWQGFNNTKALYEADKSGVNYPAIKKVLTYSTEGTSQGQWYLPAAGELQAISLNKDTLNTALTKIGGTQMSGKYWSSSEQNSGNGFLFTIGNSASSAGRKISKNKVKPIINFASKNKTDFAYNNGGTEVTCRLGDILYSDKKCYLGGMLAGKTPIGIVFDASRRTAIALESLDADHWAVYDQDTPGLTNRYDENQAKQDFNGKANMAAIKAYNSDLSKYPAAKSAYEYTTAGTNVGDWYLPALGELNTVYSNKDYINYALSLVGKKAIPTDSYHWSSSECSSYYVWVFDFNNGNVVYILKIYGGYLRPVLAF